MKTSFQTVIVIVFVVAFVAAIAIFSGMFGGGGPGKSDEPQGLVVVWGVLPQEQMQEFIDNTFNSKPGAYSVTYIERPAATFAQDLTNALADGRQPDVVIFTSELYQSIKSRLYAIPYAAYAERAYRDLNIDGAQIFLSKEGVMALPLLVDPIVVYYNRDILAGGGFVVPPGTWTGLSQTVPTFTKKSSVGNVAQSTIALGTADNITHFRDILSALFLQTGLSIVSVDPGTGKGIVTLASPGGDQFAEELPAVQALNYYLGFGDPTNANYSWNRSLGSDKDAFLAGKLAFYIGRASELFSIQEQNPNLNFDVVPLFQADNTTRQLTYGSYVSAGVMKNALNFPAAYAAASMIATKENIDAVSKKMSLPPARRDLLLIAQTNPYVSVFFRAAAGAFAWHDPNPAETERIFRDMITNVTSGKMNAQTAIYEATKNIQSNIR